MRQSVPIFPVILLASGSALAQPDPHESDGSHVHVVEHEHHGIEEVIVRATPLQRNMDELTQSATVLSGANLQREASGSLGDTLGRQPGLSNASFGQNVGRPVIRGMQGQRVGVLSNNMASGDASAVSQDHAVAVEPFLADQVEVLRGPSTLLYGSGAIGGVVNTVIHTIPKEIPEEPISGRVMAQLDSAADERFAAGRLDFGQGAFAFHANGFYRRTDDYEIPGEAHLYPDSEDHGEDEHTGALENSFLDNEGGSLGGAWISDHWRAGVSLTTYDSNYGIPGAAHHHEEDGHEEEEEEMFVTIDMESDRWDTELSGTDPFSGFERMTFRLSGVNYSHTEFEGDEVGTVFDSDTLDARLELTHLPWKSLEGTFGFQYRDVDFAAAGEEAFVPDSNTETTALFWLESLSFDAWTFDFGARYEDQDVRPDEPFVLSEQAAMHSRDFNPFSVSAGAVWHLDEETHFSLSLARAERAPTAQELYSYGSHVASQTFEIGDPTLDEESNLHIEAAYRAHGEKLTGTVTVYADSFADYIYQLNTGEEQGELPVRLWSQQDADFVGGEVEVRWDIGHFDTGDFDAGHWEVFGFYDRVRAELDDGERVPLMPPSRVGLGLDWHRETLAAHLVWIHAARHDRVAEYESATPGYDLVNLELSWLTPFGESFELEAFLNARNLLDEEIRNSTSHLKDQAPQIGRNFTAGFRSRF
jgi:iron complex outermembrane receptor protein